MSLTNVTPSQIAVVHSDPIISSLGIEDRLTRPHSPLDIEYKFNNFLPVDIVIVERSGLKFVIKGKPFGAFTGFIMRVDYRIMEETAQYLDRMLVDVDATGTEELRSFKESYNRQKAINHHRGINVSLDYEVTLDQLKANDGVLYYKNRDVIVSTLSLEDTPDHPYCENSLTNFSTAKNALPIERDCFAARIDIVDNDNSFGNRYCWFQNSVTKIIAKKDDRRSNGIYIYRAVNDITDPANFDIAYTKYEYDVAQEELGLYKSFQEAKDNGDSNLARKEELLRKEHELSVSKHDLQQQKIKQDQEMLNLQHEYAQKQHSQKVRESELNDRQAALERDRKEFDWMQEKRKQEMKDLYEYRNNERKESSDLVKMLPMIILSLAAVTAAFVKTSNNKDK